MQINLHPLRAGDRERLAEVDGGNGWNASPDLWESYRSDQDAGRRLVTLA